MSTLSGINIQGLACVSLPVLFFSSSVAYSITTGACSTCGEVAVSLAWECMQVQISPWPGDFRVVGRIWLSSSSNIFWALLGVCAVEKEQRWERMLWRDWAGPGEAWRKQMPELVGEWFLSLEVIWAEGELSSFWGTWDNLSWLRQGRVWTQRKEKRKDTSMLLHEF